MDIKTLLEKRRQKAIPIQGTLIHKYKNGIICKSESTDSPSRPVLKAEGWHSGLHSKCVLCASVTKLL